MFLPGLHIWHTLSGYFIHRYTQNVGHVTNEGENYYASKYTGQWVPNHHHYGISKNRKPLILSNQYMCLYKFPFINVHTINVYSQYNLMGPVLIA